MFEITDKLPLISVHLGNEVFQIQQSVQVCHKLLETNNKNIINKNHIK